MVELRPARPGTAPGQESDDKVGSAGGPDQDPDFKHHKNEIRAFLEKARDVAKRLPKNAREEAMQKIRDIASKVGLEM